MNIAQIRLKNKKIRHQQLIIKDLKSTIGLQRDALKKMCKLLLKIERENEK